MNTEQAMFLESIFKGIFFITFIFLGGLAFIKLYEISIWLIVLAIISMVFITYLFLGGKDE